MAGCRAILLLGPTGSGKTPLGDFLEERGIWGRRCVHFDFGAALRQVAAGAYPPATLDKADRDVVASSLATGALLTGTQFHIARRVFATFSERRGLRGDHLLVLNGLPRHTDQADDAAALADVRMVLHLECGPETVAERIRLDTGGDRSDRTDDSAEMLTRKLAVFRRQSLPLLDYYRARRVSILSVEITAQTTAATICQALAECPFREVCIR